MKVCEMTIQAILMNWLMDNKHHEFVIPNSTVIFPWESDLISVTNALLSHEYEIKLNFADYKRDAKKLFKHSVMGTDLGPSYFWYVTNDFDIDPPTNAGWIKMVPRGSDWMTVNVKREAPRLHTVKLSPRKQSAVTRLLSWRLTNMMKLKVT